MMVRDPGLTSTAETHLDSSLDRAPPFSGLDSFRSQKLSIGCRESPVHFGEPTRLASLILHILMYYDTREGGKAEFHTKPREQKYTTSYMK